MDQTVGDTSSARLYADVDDFENHEEVDPLDAPPIPFRVGGPPLPDGRYRLTHATPIQAAHRRYTTKMFVQPVLPALERREVSETEEVQPRWKVPDFRASLPEPVPEGGFNPGIALALGVVILAAGSVLLWQLWNTQALFGT